LKKLNLVKDENFNIEATNTYIDNQIKDDGWKTTFKKIIADCLQNITSEADALQKLAEKPPCLFKKETCDVRYSIINNSILLRTVIVSWVKQIKSYLRIKITFAQLGMSKSGSWLDEHDGLQHSQGFLRILPEQFTGNREIHARTTPAKLVTSCFAIAVMLAEVNKKFRNN